MRSAPRLYTEDRSEVISPNIHIYAYEYNEAVKAPRDFAASIAPANRLPTRKITILDQEYEIPGLDHLLRHKSKLGKLWHETRDPACKTAVNWVSRNIRRMVQKRAHERWETKLANCEVTHQVIWPIAKSLAKSGGPKTPSEIHGPLGPIFYPIDKANIIADCLENQFRARDLCD
jgi:hypothetical protein